VVGISQGLRFSVKLSFRKTNVVADVLSRKSFCICLHWW